MPRAPVSQLSHILEFYLMADRHTKEENTFPHMKTIFDYFMILWAFMKYISRVKAQWINDVSAWVLYLTFRCNKVTEFPTSNLKPQILGWKGMENDPSKNSLYRDSEVKTWYDIDLPAVVPKKVLGICVQGQQGTQKGTGDKNGRKNRVAEIIKFLVGYKNSV